MKTKEFRIFVYEYNTVEELPNEDQELIFAAREIAKMAYAPYSKFRVGAALKLENNEIIRGNNQENAAFSTGICAERVALYYANAAYPHTEVKAMAVTAFKNNGPIKFPVKPCGSCRQALCETEVRFGKPIRIVLVGEQKIQVFEGIRNLLPFAFKPESLD